jgi:hypothetical protein
MGLFGLVGLLLMFTGSRLALRRKKSRLKR